MKLYRWGLQEIKSNDYGYPSNVLCIFSSVFREIFSSGTPHSEYEILFPDVNKCSVFDTVLQGCSEKTSKV